MNGENCGTLPVWISPPFTQRLSRPSVKAIHEDGACVFLPLLCLQNAWLRYGLVVPKFELSVVKTTSENRFFSSLVAARLR